MATKAQLEESCRQYEHLWRRCRAELEANQFGKAVETARTGLVFMQDVIRYQRKYQQQTTIHLPTINTILHYAPPLFLTPSLDALAEWWETLSRTEQQSVAAVPNEINTARDVLLQASALWASVAQLKTPLPRPPGARNTAIITIWVQVGLAVLIEPNSFTLVTHLRRHLEAKCTRCGFTAFGSLLRLLEPILCPACQHTGLFTIVKRWL